MIEDWPSEPNRRGIVPARPLRGQVLLVAGAALLVVGSIVLWRMGLQAAPAQQPVKTAAVSAPAKNPVLDELVKETRALSDSQQQAIDQLQVLQDTVATQAAALKASSDQVAALNDKLEALRQTFASAAQPAPEQAAKPQPHHVKHPTAHRKHKPHRTSKRHRSRAHH